MDIAESSDSIQYIKIVFELCGGLAIFLYGMNKLTEGLKAAAGSGIKTILAKLTQNRFTSLFAGAMITAIIQSSSVTTVLMVGFISAGLLSSAQSVGVIIGANIGTTITAQIIAFKISQYGLVMLAVGFLVEMVSKNERLRQYAIVLMSLGFIFFGMQIMSNATKPLREFEPFISLMRDLHNPLLAILIATAFTAIVQSSSATTGIVIVLAKQGFIPLEAGIALILGSNIGTCVTAMLASIGKPREAVKAGLIHVIFNVVGVLIWLPFINQFAELARMVSPTVNHLQGVEKLAMETPRQIANAHTLFNVANALIFIGFTIPLAALVNKLLPGKPVRQKSIREPQYLDPIFISQPELAIDSVRLELARLGRSVMELVQDSYPAIKSDRPESIQKLKQMDDQGDRLYCSIVDYLRTLTVEELSQRQTRMAYHYLALANIFLNIGEIIENNLVYQAEERRARNIRVSPGTLDYLESLHKQLSYTGRQAIQSVQSYSTEIAVKAMDTKMDFNNLLKEARHHLAGRLIKDEPDRVEAYKLETDIMESYKHLHTLFRRIAKLIISIRKIDAGKPLKV